MTTNECKILRYLWDADGRAQMKAVARAAGFTADYTRLMCRSLVRTEYLTGAEASVCELSIKGRNCFQGSGGTKEKERAKKAATEAEEPPQTMIKKTNGQKKKKKLDGRKDATPQEKERLAKAGYASAEDLAAAPVSRLMQDIGVSIKKAADWINQARRQTGMIDEKKGEFFK